MTTLFVASGGGHLVELSELAPRLHGVDPDGIWVTWDSPQSRAMLRDRRTVFVRPTPPRSPLAVAANIDHAARLWRPGDVSALVTAGSQLVLPFLVAGSLRGRPSHFIESAARVHAPSVTARLAERIPRVTMYSQHPGGGDRGWPFVGSIFDGYSRGETDRVRDPSRFVVTLGTMPRWQFRGLVEACLRVLPPDGEVLWQTGHTDVSDLGIEGRVTVPADELETAMVEADVVISHAGVGSALTALRCGRHPVLVPRRARLREHVDDHQTEIAEDLRRRGIARVRTPDGLTSEDLKIAAGRSTARASSLAPILLATAN